MSINTGRSTASPGLHAAIGLCCLIALPGCREGTGPNDTGLIEHQVRPSATNPAIHDWNEPHLAWANPATVATSAALLLFLPGTGGQPANTRAIAELAARSGYHVVGLMYPNHLAVVAACAADPEPTCMEKMRAEIVDGVDHSPHVQVQGADGIGARLTSLLRYLTEAFPGEGWDRFLDGTIAVNWRMVLVGGLSQGGGHAAYIARTREVARVVMFGAPADGFNGQPAPWMQLGLTPAERYYGFAHERDPFTSIVPNWQALGLGMFGSITRVETSAAPFQGTHLLQTDLLPATGSFQQAHPSVVTDATTPRNPDGTFRFEPVWRYLLGISGG